MNTFHWDNPPFHWDNPFPLTVSATSYGVKADGTTDDTAAIQAAIDSLEDTGGLVKLPPGIIYRAGSVEPKSGVSLDGVRPLLSFGANCPDLNFTMIGGTVFKASTTGLTCFAANTTDSPGTEADPLSNVKFSNFGIKGFQKGFDIGAIDQKGMGFGGFHSIYIDGTGDDDVTVQTELAFDLTNCQQMVSDDVMIYKVTNGIKQVNDHATCSSGNTFWGKAYIYMDPDTSSVGSATVSTVTVGSTTTIDFTGAHGLAKGDVIQIAGCTGTHASLINRVHKVDSITDTDTIVLDLNTSGKTITAGSGTMEKGRVGIHLVGTGQPLNHVTFAEPQVNFFIQGGEQAKAFCNVAICGLSDASVGATSFLQTDMEGDTDHNIYVDGATSLTLQIATSYVNAPTLGHVACYNTSSANIVSSSGDTTLKLGDTGLQGGGSTDGNLGIMLYGVIKSFISNSRMPQNGQWYEITAAAGYASCGTLYRSIEFDQTSFSWGPPKGESTWAALRLVSKFETAVTGDRTVASTRMGLHRCTNASNSTLTLPQIGTANNQADEGVIVVVSKVSGAGTMDVATTGGDTIGMQASPYTGLAAVAGRSVTLMSDGVSDWIIMGSN